MTEAEKAAAVKAEAEKKAAAEKEAAEAKAKEAEEAAAEDEPEEGDDKGTISKKDFEAFKKKSNKENEKHRLAAKEANEKFDAFQKNVGKALGFLPADGAAAADPTAALKASEAKQRELILRAQFAEKAKDAGVVNVADAFVLAKKYLGDVKVSIEADLADDEGIDEALEKLKEAKPYLFKVAGSDGGEGGDDEPKPKGKMPDGGGNPAKGGGTAFNNWQALVKAGRTSEANAFYGKNKPAIKASWPK